MKDMSRCVDESIETIRNFVKDEFDGFVFLTYNSEKNTVGRSWSFMGHPGSWSQKDLCEMAQQITSVCAEAMKEDVNIGRPAGPINKKIEPTYFSLLKPETAGKYKRVFGFGIGLNPFKPVWVQFFTNDYFSLGVWTVKNVARNGTPYRDLCFGLSFWTLMFSKDS